MDGNQPVPVETIEEVKDIQVLYYVPVHGGSYNQVLCPFCNESQKLYRWASEKNCDKCKAKLSSRTFIATRVIKKLVQ